MTRARPCPNVPGARHTVVRAYVPDPLRGGTGHGHGEPPHKNDKKKSPCRARHTVCQRWKEGTMGASPADMAMQPEWLSRGVATTNLDRVIRLSLGRLDPRRATPEQVRDALDAAGVQVPLAWASEWLDGRRGHGTC